MLYNDYKLSITLQNSLIVLIFISIAINIYSYSFPLLRNDDPVLYAVIAKNMLLQQNWINLTYPLGQDWLDKPHLMFWLVAAFFKIFGIHAYAYCLSGFCFYLLGGYYTYRLTNIIYNNNIISTIAALIYFSNIHLLISSSFDIRAEVYLIGMIMPASYYWYRYFILNTHSTNSNIYTDNNSIKLFTFDLILGGIFTALAVITKGIFIALSIFSVLTVMICFMIIAVKDKPKLYLSIKKSLSLKLLLAIILTIIFIIPEIVSLYLQFDLHPEKLIHNQYGVSGIKWFFIDSQWGRFFNNGDITRNNINAWHYLFFIHTFIWSFLPWTQIFVIFLYKNIIHIKSKSLLLLKTHKLISNAQKQSKLLFFITKINKNHLFLMLNIVIPFLMFSCAKFQLDHYINIILPFVAIVCANYIFNNLLSINTKSKEHKILFNLHLIIMLVILLITLVLNIAIIDYTYIMSIILILLSAVLIIYIFYNIICKQHSRHSNIMIYLYIPTIAINLTFITLINIYGHIVINYDIGYNAAKYINKIMSSNSKQLITIEPQINSLTLDFYLNNDLYIANKTNTHRHDINLIKIIPYADIKVVLQNIFYLPLTHKQLKYLKIYSLPIKDGHI